MNISMTGPDKAGEFGPYVQVRTQSPKEALSFGKHNLLQSEPTPFLSFDLNSQKDYRSIESMLIS